MSAGYPPLRRRSRSAPAARARWRRCASAPAARPPGDQATAARTPGWSPVPAYDMPNPVPHSNTPRAASSRRPRGRPPRAQVGIIHRRGPCVPISSGSCPSAPQFRHQPCLQLDARVVRSDGNDFGHPHLMYKKSAGRERVRRPQAVSGVWRPAYRSPLTTHRLPPPIHMRSRPRPRQSAPPPDGRLRDRWESLALARWQRG